MSRCLCVFLQTSISIPTRFARKTVTLIMHIFANPFLKVSQFGVIKLSISDCDLI